MPIKSQTISLIILALFLSAFREVALPECADAAKSDIAFSAAMQSAETLYSQKQYASAVSAFESLIKTQSPNARLYYFAALANQAAGNVVRAKNLFTYLTTNFPQTQEGINAKKFLAAGLPQTVTAGTAITAGKSTEDSELPESVKNALSPQMQELLKTDAGRLLVKQMLQEKADAVKTIKTAEKSGVIDKKAPLPATRNITPPRARVAGEIHPFTAEDIAREGANGIDQMRYPNCWFEASMSALARLPRGQRLLASMIRSGKTDGYIVRFPNDGVEYVITQKYMDDNDIHDKALWASIIECAQIKKFPDNKGAEGANSDQSRLEVGLQCITGAKAEVIWPKDCSNQELSSFIGGAVKSGNPIVAGTYAAGTIYALPHIIVPQHAYTVIGFDPSTELILMRNPHGAMASRFELESDPHHHEFEQLDDGVFKLSISQFKNYFHSIARSFI